MKVERPQNYKKIIVSFISFVNSLLFINSRRIGAVEFKNERDRDTTKSTILQRRPKSARFAQEF